MNKIQSFTVKKLLIIVCALVLFPVSAGAQIVGFSEDFDGPTLDAAFTFNGNPANQLGFVTPGQFSITSINALTPTGAEIFRLIDGTRGDFTASVTVSPSPFHDPDNSLADFAWQFSGPDGAVDIVWNSFDNVRVSHNDFSTAGDAGQGNLVVDVQTEYVDGDSIEFELSYVDATETVSISFSLNGGASTPIFSGTGNGDGLGDFYTIRTDVQVFQFGNMAVVNPVINIDSLEFAPGGPVGDVILGDANVDGVVDFSDIPAFIAILQGGILQAQSDIDSSGVVDFSDIPLFIAILQAS